MSQKIINGDSATVLKQFENNTIDAVITDPPYGIEFLGKDWDSNTGAVEIWQECLRILKPGGHLLAFSAARTYHHLATNIESVGFEIRDQIMWLYASGFPKAQDIGKAIDKRQGIQNDFVDYHKDSQDTRTVSNNGNAKNRHCKECGKQLGTNKVVCDKSGCKILNPPKNNEWHGWKTALKPAHEPIVMARKPFKGSTIDTVLTHGVGALNIDATRIPFESAAEAEADRKWREKWSEHNVGAPTFQGTDINEQRANKKHTARDNKNVVAATKQGRFPANVLGDIVNYQKYFYCPKVTRSERHRGFEQDQVAVYDRREDRSDQSAGIQGLQQLNDRRHNKKDPLAHIPTNPEGMYDVDGTGQQYNSNKYKAVGNNHPTVKPVELMKYLVKLVTPEGAHVIDPFAGSGSTGMACRELARRFTGIDLDANYCEIARKRISATQEDKTETLFE